MGVFDSLMRKMGLDDPDEVEIDEVEVRDPRDARNIEPVVSKPYNKPTPAKVVSIHQNQQYKMMVVQPSNLEDAKEICDYLKDKKPVVVNIDIQGLKNEMPQRILDFLSGSVYALDGTIETVTKGIYVVVPSNVDITNQIK
jgi:cell division inhibitor SepF